MGTNDAVTMTSIYCFAVLRSALLVGGLSDSAPTSRNELLLLFLAGDAISILIKVCIPSFPEVSFPLVAFAPDDLVFPVKFHDFIIIPDKPRWKLPPGLTLYFLQVQEQFFLPTTRTTVGLGADLKHVLRVGGDAHHCRSADRVDTRKLIALNQGRALDALPIEQRG